MEALLSQLNETVSSTMKPQITQLTETVANNSVTIAETSASMQRMEALLQTLVQKVDSASSSTHGHSNSNSNSHHDHGRNLFQTRNVKLEFPRFDGSHALEWLFKADQFFDYYATPDQDRLTIAAIHMVQSVVPWFQMLQRTKPFQSWSALSRAIELEFGPSAFDRPRAALFKLSQTGSLSDYYLEFTALANRVTGLDQEAVMDCFISGLQKDLQREVISQKSSSLIQAVSIARLFEDKFNPTKPSTSPIISNSKSLSTNTVTPNRSLSSQGSNTYSTSRNSLPPLLPTPTTKPTAFNPKSPNIKSISPAEMQLRREKGLCYYCDEKFSFKHRCPNKHLLLLQLEDAHPEEPDSEPPDITLNEPENAEPQHHLSLNAIRGASGVGTLRFTGHIAGLPIQILVDGGSSESFFQPRIAHLLHLPIESGPRFNVLVGNGPRLSVTIQGHELTVPVFLLLVVGADLIIGSPWLATLGPHVADYASLSLKFFLDGKFITLQGQKDASPTLAQLHHIRRFHHTKSISEVFTIQTIPPESSHALSLHLPPDIDPAMRQLLSKFSSVFQVPTRLPPQRDQDHAIPLVDESQWSK